MQNRTWVRISMLQIVFLACLAAGARVAAAREGTEPPPPAVVCQSRPGERISCAAETRAGVTLTKTMGPVACELGKTWGYDERSIWVSDGCAAEFSTGPPEAKRNATYSPTRGFKVADTASGDLNVRLWTYVRYLNQSALDDTFTDSFGTTSNLDLRQDVQLNKVNIYFYGWLLNPKFRYLLYVWSANTSQGLGAQVVVAGNLTYAFNEHFTLGGGINGLPGVRTTEGNSPFWLGVDQRLIADEFFRPSYTSGVWALGRIVKGLNYNVMLGNNLSQLGVDAGQLDDLLNTVSASVSWLPTTGEFGDRGGYGDFEEHEVMATRFGLHYTRSHEDRQSQPNTDSFENVQLRLSDGNVIFTPGLFGSGIAITDAIYQMTALDAGFKHRGYAVEGEYYLRRLNDFQGPGTAGLPFDRIDDHGFQLQASAMLRPKSVQAYLSGSKVYGDYGDPWDLRIGVNWFPWKNEVARWNFEVIDLHRSPVGGLSLPYPVGGSGPVFSTNFELRL